MKRLLPLLLLASCATPSVSPEVRSIVPLIKAERYDEAAANPDLLAPAFAEALRQLNAEGADPEKVVRVADFFFDSYPFSVKDLELDETIFTSVADAHFEAKCRLVLETPECRKLQSGRTFADLVAVLLTWPEGEHEDGGRCARFVRTIYEGAVRRGKDWYSDTTITGDLSEPDEDLIDACSEAFDRQPEMILLSFTAARAGFLTCPSRIYSWASYARTGPSRRWAFMINGRGAWLEAYLFESEFRSITNFREELLKSKHAVLLELGAAFEAWNAAGSDFAYEAVPDVERYRKVFSMLDRSAPGTPFRDAARSSLISQYVNLNRLDEAERWIRELRAQFSDPAYPSLALLRIVDHRSEDEDVPANLPALIRLAREALEWDPRGPFSGVAHTRLAQLYLASHQEREAFESMTEALRLSTASGPCESNAVPYSRDRAGKLLALHHERRKEWALALEAWKSWDSHHGGCGLHGENNYEEMQAGIGRCQDALGRRKEAAEHYWLAITIMSSHDMDLTRRLLALHQELGTVAELKAKVTNLVSDRNRYPAHILWLAGELGVPIENSPK